MASTFPHPVGRGFDPAGGIYLAYNVPGFLYIPRTRFFILDALRAAWPRFELPTVPLFDRPKSGEKSRRYFRGAGHGQGACGPLWKPRGFKVVARDSFRVSQPFIRFYPSPGPCLPEPLIRAPVLRPRPPSRAGHFPGGVHAAPTCNGSLCGKHQNHACQTAPRRGQDARPTNPRNLRMKMAKCKFPSGRRAGS